MSPVIRPPPDRPARRALEPRRDRGRTPPTRTRACATRISTRPGSSVTSPSRSSSRSWNASPSGAPYAASVAVTDPTAPASAAPIRSGPSTVYEPPLSARRSGRARGRRRRRPGPARAPCRSASGGSGRARRPDGPAGTPTPARGGRRARRRDRRPAARGTRRRARGPASHAVRACSVSWIALEGAPRRSGLRSMRSSWINAIVCSSSSAAAARSIGSPSTPPAAR